MAAAVAAAGGVVVAAAALIVVVLVVVVLVMVVVMVMVGVVSMVVLLLLGQALPRTPTLCVLLLWGIPSPETWQTPKKGSWEAVNLKLKGLMDFPKLRGTIVGGPHNKDYSILGSILGPLTYGDYHDWSLPD